MTAKNTVSAPAAMTVEDFQAMLANGTLDVAMLQKLQDATSAKLAEENAKAEAAARAALLEGVKAEVAKVTKAMDTVTSAIEAGNVQDMLTAMGAANAVLRTAMDSARTAAKETGVSVTGTGRARPGELQPLVLEYVIRNGENTPAKIASGLTHGGRPTSSGAATEACRSLVKQGKFVCIKEFGPYTVDAVRESAPADAEGTEG